MARSTMQVQLAELAGELEAMGRLVEQAIANGVSSLVNHDVRLAESVITGDLSINDKHLKIERLCLSILALQQPAAGDLRRVASTLKVITDLERMADHAVSIARVAVRLGNQPHVKPLVDIPAMATIAQTMVTDALGAFLDRDRDRALAMIEKDHQVDHLQRTVIEDLQRLMENDSKTVQQGIQLLFVSHSLERIADHATNLGEWLIYAMTGERTELNM